MRRERDVGDVGRPLQLEAVRQLVPLGDGTWRITGGDPQFLVRGPFARGVWEWTFRAGATTDTPGPALRIYYSQTAGSGDGPHVTFPPLQREPAERHLRFWLADATDVLRFDPADAPGLLVLGDISATRRGRLSAVARAFADRFHRHGAAGVFGWLRELTAAARAGGMTFRVRLVELIAGEEGLDSREWIAATVPARAPKYHAEPVAGLFSILTTVYDTPAPYLRELAGSLAAQTWADYEWILLDNGSRDPATLETLRAIAADPRVTLLRADANLGILGGMRRVLERATGRYALPVDSDDWLAPDALAIAAAVLQREHHPPLAYSDEDKLRDGRHVDPFEKPGWDPVYLRNSPYIAHLCAVRRDDALRLGVYTDPGAEGCHDWDTFLRFWRAGLAPVHVPEILYSWRMHSGSTAARVDAKDYVTASQRHVLEVHLAESGLADRFTVERSPFFPASPHWWIRRTHVAPPPAALVVHGAGDVETDYRFAHVTHAAADEPPLRAWQRAAAAAPGVVVVCLAAAPTSAEWIWEMAGLKESFPDAAIIGGRLIDRNGSLLETGHAAGDAGYFGMALKQRSAAVVPLRLAMLDSGWLRTIDPASCDALDIDALASVLAQHARAAGMRVIVSPFIEAAVV